MSANNRSKKAGQLSTFGGESCKFQMFGMRLEAYAKLMGFFEAINNTPHPNLPTNDKETVNEMSAHGKIKAKAKGKNNLARPV